MYKVTRKEFNTQITFVARIVSILWRLGWVSRQRPNSAGIPALAPYPSISGRWPLRYLHYVSGKLGRGCFGPWISLLDEAREALSTAAAESAPA